jgi:hypothetical protein
MFEFLYLAAALLRQGGVRAYNYLKANFTRLGIPDPATDLRVPKEEFDEALTAAEDKNTGEAATRRKDEAEAAFDKAFRNFGTEQCGALSRLPLCCLLCPVRKGE